MKKADTYFVLALACYCVPAFAVVWKQEAVIAMNPFAYLVLPFANVAVFTDRYLPAFYLMGVPALFFFSLCFHTLTLQPLRRTVLSTLSSLAVFFAIPSLTWPIGSLYYETLEFYMGQLSLVGVFFILFLYMHWRR